MDINRARLPDDMVETLKVIYNKLKEVEPSLTESSFFERVIGEWLEPYRRRGNREVQRGKVRLKNNLERAIKLSGKSQAQLAQEIGVNRVYLSYIKNGKYEPSITLALLMADTLGYQNIRDLFYLEPAPEE